MYTLVIVGCNIHTMCIIIHVQTVRCSHYRLKEIKGMKKNCPGSMTGIRVHSPLRHKSPGKNQSPPLPLITETVDIGQTECS